MFPCIHLLPEARVAIILKLNVLEAVFSVLINDFLQVPMLILSSTVFLLPENVHNMTASKLGTLCYHKPLSPFAL